MIKYVLRRFGYGILILIGVNLLTFMLFFAVNTPDDMARPEHRRKARDCGSHSGLEGCTRL